MVLPLLSPGEIAEAAPPYTYPQTFYVPFSEDQIDTASDVISSSSTSSTIRTTVSVSATADGTIVVYDHWEDGYESDPSNPVQASTEIFGDGDQSNGRDDLTVFARLAEAVGSPDVFRQARGITLLAPTDAAWDALDEDLLERVLSDRESAVLLLSEHLSVGGRSISDMVAEGSFRTAMSRSLEVSDTAGMIRIGGAAVLVADLMADNGYVHIVDQSVAAPVG